MKSVAQKFLNQGVDRQAPNGAIPSLPPTKALRKASLRLAILQIMVVGLTFLKEVTLTAFFGLAQFMDAYTLVNNVLIFTRSYFEQLGYGALIPAYGAQASGTDGTNQTNSVQRDFLNTTFNYIMLFTLLISGFLCWQHRWVAWIIAPAWSDTKLGHLLLLTLIVLPSCLLFQVAEMLRILSIQEKRFVLYQLPRVISLLAFIGGFALLYPQLKTTALLIVLPVSQLLELVIYCSCLGIRWRWIWNAPGLKSFLEKLAPVSLSWGIFSLSLLVDNLFLSFLPTGEPSAFRYAYVSVLIAGSLTVNNLQLTQLSEMNSVCLEGDFSITERKLKKMGLNIILFSLPIIIVSLLLAPWLIKLVYEHGAFSAQNTLMVSQCYQILIVMLPFTAIWRMLSSCYYALNLTRPLIILGLFSLGLRVVMEYAGLKLGGLKGLTWMVLGNSYLLLLCLILFLFWLKRKHSKGVAA
jgi:putative peptidoglycan lipid II flippase